MALNTIKHKTFFGFKQICIPNVNENMHLIKDHFSVTFEYHSQVEVKGQLHDILNFDMTLDVQKNFYMFYITNFKKIFLKRIIYENLPIKHKVT